MDKLKLLVLYGGISEEHDVSIKSARELSRNLDAAKYDTIYVFIGRDGMWRLTDGPDGEPRGSVFVAPQRKLFVLKDGRYELLSVDVAFPMLHGRYGEDGTVQGILAGCGIPYVGCGIAASALCIDKALAHLVVAEAGVRVPRHVILNEGDEIAAGNLGCPLFVKPARSGSSFGVSKVYREAALFDAVSDARRYDDKVLIEEAIIGSEVGCAVLGNGTDLATGELDMIELSGGFFRIHQEAKPEQGSENSTVRVPAPVSEEARMRLIETAKTIYSALGCSGLARVDMFLTPEGDVVMNEVNSMPGLTSYSRYPRMMEAAGVTMREVVDRLIELALEKDGGRI